MAEVAQIFPGRLILFCATVAEWAANDIVIPQGEFVGEIGFGSPPAMKIKFGNGTDVYSVLPYVFTGGSGGTGDLQSVLNVGNIAVTDLGAGNVGAIALADSSQTFGSNIDYQGLLINDVDTDTAELTAKKLHFEDNVNSGDADYGSGQMHISKGVNTAIIDPSNVAISGTGGTSNMQNLFFWLKNTANEIVAQLINQAGRGELWLKLASVNVISKIVPTSTNHETFALPNKGGVGGTFAMTSDIPSPHPAGTPTATYGAGAGTSPGAFTITGNDRSGIVQFVTGTTPSASSAVFTLTFNTPFPSPGVNVFFDEVFSGINSPFVTGVLKFSYNANTTSVQFIIGAVPLTSSTTYAVSYMCFNRL